MGKIYVNTVKYEILTEFSVDGVVDQHDVVGAIFGQSEGLLGEDLDLRELQKNGKIGRIRISLRTNRGKSTGTLSIPSSMDRVETSLLAAAVETVDKVGPCDAAFSTKQIQDTRRSKRDVIQKRAQELLSKLVKDEMPESDVMTQQLREQTRVAGAKSVGRARLPSGPGVEDAASVILVEGRADVNTMLKYNIKNVLGIGGAKIPRELARLVKGKEVTLFIDGDRGGLLNLRKLQALLPVDYVAVAPDGKEVEELVQKEIMQALRHRMAPERFQEERDRRGRGRPAQARTPLRVPERGTSRTTSRTSPRAPRRTSTRTRRTTSTRTPPRHTGRGTTRTPGRRGTGTRTGARTRPRQRFEEPEEKAPSYAPSAEDEKRFGGLLKKMGASLKASMLDAKDKPLKEVNVRELLKALEKEKKVKAVVLDGIITQRLVDAAAKAGVKELVGVKHGQLKQEDSGVRVVVMK